MKKWTSAIAACMGVLFCSHLACGASLEMEILLKKLQEKGVLTKAEADEIARETKEAAEAQKAEAKETAVKTAAETAKAATETVEKKEASKKGMELPSWLQNHRLWGDLRLRYEQRDRADDARGSQGRGRFRLRVGDEIAIVDGLTAGFSLASGTGDLRTANQTFGGIPTGSSDGSFVRRPVWIDTAYARYAPAKWFSVIGGKFVNPVWQPADMVMSADINPEGGALRFEGELLPGFGLFLNSALFVLDDRNGASRSAPDPLMYVLQPGFKWNLTKDIFFRFAPAYYGFTNLRGTPVLAPANTSLSSTNTATAAGNYRYAYNAIDWAGELGIADPFGIRAIPYAGIMGGYLHNPDPAANNDGYLIGFSIGYREVKQWGDWALEYTFRRLEKDAVIDLFPDTSFYQGNTNVMGHRVKFLFGLTKNTALGLNLYDTWKIRGFSPASSLAIPAAARTLSSEEYLGQVDLIFKF